MPDDPNINEYGVSHDDWDDMSQNEQRDTAHEHGDDWHGQPPPGTDGGDDSSQQTTASADTGRPPTFHADTPPTFHSDAQQEAWLADQRAKLWDSYELERKSNVQKGRDDWSRSNKEREDRLRSERGDEAADQAREERENQESRWSTEDEAEGLLRSRDRERYVDRDMEASKDPNVNEYGISHNDWDDLSQNEQRDVAHSFDDDWHGQPPPTDDSGGSSQRTFHTFEAALVDKGLTPDEIALVRERQGGTITKFEQDDADAVNAMRDALGAQAVAEQVEAALLAQGATPEEIAYVRERQGGTLTQFDQDDADAVNARRGVLGAQAVAEQIEAALTAQGATPEEIAYVRERQGGTLTKFEQDDADAVNARRGVLGAQAVAEQVEAALLAQGLTPDEIAYVRERQGGTLTQFDQDDADAVNAMRDALGAQAVAEQVEAALLAQGATPEEIAYVRERQGGTLTKFEQDDADAVNARRGVLGAQAVAEQVEAALLAQGLTPEEIAYVRERQGGTLTKLDQDDVDAVNARRGVLGAQAVAEQVEAALLAQGATPEEIAYVRERQGGTLTKFEQDDADAVNAMRDALGAQAVAEQVEAALLAQGATPEEIAYVRERQGGTLTQFDQDDADAVNARRGVLGAQAVAEQVEAALLAQGATPEEIAYVRERQGGTLTKLDQDDVDAVNAMRRIAVTAAAATAQETEWLEDQDQLADQYRAIADYQVRADLWESEESMGAPEVNPELLRAWVARTSLDSGEQFDQPGSLPAYDIPRELVAPTPEDARAIERDARQISQGLFPEPPIESVSEAEAAHFRLERILNRSLMPAPEPSPKDSALLDAIGTAHEQAGFHAQEYQRAFAEGRHEDAQESMEAARNFAHVYNTLITKVDTYTPDTPDTPDMVIEGQETVDAQTIYALAFPGRSPEEIAAARDLYPSRSSFDREAIERAKLNTRNDPAQSAMVDEFAVSQGYQPLELDMSADAVNARRRRAIISTAALWTLPFTIGWGPLAGGAAGAAIGATAHAVAPADGERWFELTAADPMRAAHGAQEGGITGYGGSLLGLKALQAVGKYAPKVLRSLPGRWGTEATGGAVSDTGLALRDGQITRNEALYEIGGGAVLSPALDLGTRGAKGAVQVSRQASRIVLPTQLSIPKTGLTVPLGGGFIPLTTPAPRVPHLTVVRKGKQGEAISGDVFDQMALTGEYEGVIGQTAVSFKPGRMSEALHQANPDLPLYYSATPVGKIISTGPIAMDKPDLGPSEQYFFASPGDVNPKFMGGSAFGGSGSSPGIFAYTSLDAKAVGSEFERVMASPDDVKYYHGYEAERGIHSGEQIPPAKRVATAGVLGGQLYLGAHVTPPSFSQRLQANVNAITDAVRGEQRGRFVFQKATPEQLADRIEADQMAARQTWDESLASGKVDSEDRAGFMDAAHQRTLDDIAGEQATFDRAMADRIEADQMAASQTWDESLASGKVDSEDRAGFMDAAHQRTLDDIAGEQATFDRAMADRIEADQMAASQTWDESLTSGKVDSEDRAEFMDAAYQRTLDDIAEEQALYDRALAAQADLEDMLRQNGGTPAERALLERVQGYLGKRSLHPGLSLDLEAGIERELLAFDDSRRTIGDPRTPLTPEPLRDLPGDLDPEPLRDLPGGLDPEPLRDLPGDLDPEPLRDLPGDLDPEPLRDLPGGLDPEPLRDLPGGLDPEPLRDLPGDLDPEPLRDLPGDLPPEPLRDLPGDLPPEPLRDLPGDLPPEPLRDLPGGLPPENLRDLPGGLPPEDLRDLPGGLPPEDLRDLPGGLPPNKRRPRVRAKSIEAELAEGVNPVEHPRVIRIETPPTEVTLNLATGERSTRTLGSNRRFRVLGTDPEPVTNASHQGRTAEVGTGPAGKVRAKHIEETRYQPNSVRTHQPTMPRPKRTGLTPKPPKPPSTKAPRARGRSKGRAAFTAAMRK